MNKNKLNIFLLIDNAAQSYGAILDGRLIGAFVDAGFFSFLPGN
jgi:dTDP-4-amino-4,6-dideoxygalactose transaminase